MRNLKLTSMLVTVVLGLGLSACDKDEDTPVNNTVSKTGISLSPANEIQTPAVVSPATGTMNVTYNKVTHELKYDITWNNLTSDSIVGSHIHGPASKTQNAGVKVPFTLTPVKTGSYSGTANVDGVAIKEDSLLAGFYYLNIHTNRYKAGEIRGQIEFQ